MSSTMADSVNGGMLAENVEPAALSLVGVNRTFRENKNVVEVLSDVSLVVNAGETVALIGPSGAGKSTLLQIAGLLDRPDSGEIHVSGRSCGDANDAVRTRVRRVEIGFVYQFHHLLPEFTALENVALPQLINGFDKKEASDRAAQLLEYMDIENRAQHRPAELSGGERQRVAIARAVANGPSLLLADEPTGNLDLKTSRHVFDALSNLVSESGLAALIVTHNMALAESMDRRFTLSDGNVLEIA